MTTVARRLSACCLVALSMISILTGCNEDDPVKPAGSNPSEMITTVTFTLTELDGSGNPTTMVTTATWQDLDGDGGNLPAVDTIRLRAGKSYAGTIALTDESKNPPEDITEEVREEGDVHAFYYKLGDLTQHVLLEVKDKDTHGFAVGLEYRITVNPGTTIQDNIRVVLRHYEEGNKSAGESAGETDVDILVPVIISL